MHEFPHCLEPENIFPSKSKYIDKHYDAVYKVEDYNVNANL